MKKYLIIAVALMMALCGCKKKPEPLTVTGQWQLSNIEMTKSVKVGDETVDVYLEFLEDGTFNIYQTLGKGRPRHYAGTYTLTEDILNGKYSDGKNWAASYKASKDGGNLVLVNTQGQEVDTYISATIPQDVIDTAI